VYQFFDTVYIVYNGALRGAGDTFIPAVATSVLCWGITVFAARWTAVHFHTWGSRRTMDGGHDLWNDAGNFHLRQIPRRRLGANPSGAR
jgi:Na+-driven multidrug efflux pump